MPWIVTFRALHQDRRAALNVSRTESPLRCNSASKSADGFLFITHLFTCCVIMPLASVTGHTNASCAVLKSPEETTDNSCFSLLIDVRQSLRFFFFLSIYLLNCEVNPSRWGAGGGTWLWFETFVISCQSIRRFFCNHVFHSCFQIDENKRKHKLCENGPCIHHIGAGLRIWD